MRGHLSVKLAPASLTLPQAVIHYGAIVILMLLAMQGGCMTTRDSTHTHSCKDTPAMLQQVAISVSFADWVTPANQC